MHLFKTLSLISATTTVASAVGGLSLSTVPVDTPLPGVEPVQLSFRTALNGNLEAYVGNDLQYFIRESRPKYWFHVKHHIKLDVMDKDFNPVLTVERYGVMLKKYHIRDPAGSVLYKVSRSSLKHYTMYDFKPKGHRGLPRARAYKAYTLMELVDHSTKKVMGTYTNKREDLHSVFEYTLEPGQPGPVQVGMALVMNKYFTDRNFHLRKN